MACRAFPCFVASLWSGENSIGQRTFCEAKSRVYDRFGNRVAMNYVTAITGNEKSSTYEYDKNNRLVEETITGNLWTSEIAPESVVSYTYYEYDSMGNLVSKRGTESDLGSGEDKVGLNVLKTSPNNTLVEMYDYDGFNRLRQVRKGGTTAQYTYNAEGIRTAKTVNGETTQFILDGGNVIGEVNPQNQVTNYIRGASGLILSKDPSNVMRYYVTNGHGDVTGLTDTSGTVIKSYTYDAFGIEQNIDSNDTNPFRYCGEYFDSETQSIYLRARYYSPAVGRFTQQDPAMDGLNWYVYCSSNPVNRVDVTGMWDVGLRDFVESLGGTVTPHKHFGLFGLKSITVELNGKTKTYTSDDYWIGDDDRANIDNTKLRDDFFGPDTHGDPYDKHPTAQQVKSYIIYEAINAGVPPALALAVAYHESGYKQYRDDGTLNDNYGDVGVMQISRGSHGWAFNNLDIENNWQANVSYGIGVLADGYRAASAADYTGEELIKATYSYYNGGFVEAYHVYQDANVHVWEFYKKYICDIYVENLTS